MPEDQKKQDLQQPLQAKAKKSRFQQFKGPRSKKLSIQKAKALANMDCFDGFDESSESQSSQSLRAVASIDINSFFYTNDQFFTRVDDDVMVRYLQQRFPNFLQSNTTMQAQKKVIVQMLSDAKFMDDFLSYYDISVVDFFGLVYRLEPDLFKGTFLNRIQDAMRYKKYAIKAKRATYHGRKRARLRELKKAKLRRT